MISGLPENVSFRIEALEDWIKLDGSKKESTEVYRRSICRKPKQKAGIGYRLRTRMEMIVEGVRTHNE